MDKNSLEELLSTLLGIEEVLETIKGVVEKIIVLFNATD